MLVLIAPLGICLLSVALLWRLWRIRRTFSSFNHLPAYSVLFSPVYPFGRMLPGISRLAAGSTFAWQNAYECRSPIVVLFRPAPDLGPTAIFRKVGSDIVVLRSLSPLPQPYLLIADATALKVQFYFSVSIIIINHTTDRQYITTTAHSPSPRSKSIMASGVTLVPISFRASMTNGGNIDGSPVRVSLRATTAWCGNRRLMLSLGISKSVTVMAKVAPSKWTTLRKSRRKSHSWSSPQPVCQSNELLGFH